MAGKAMLETMPLWFGHVERLGKLCSSIFAAVQEAGCGTLVCHGQGLMWGTLFTYHEPSRRQQAMDVLKHHCRGSDDRLLQNDEITAATDGQENAIWPYFVPAGGFMVTPPLDTTVDELVEMGRRMVVAVEKTAKELRRNDDSWSLLTPKALL